MVELTRPKLFWLAVKSLKWKPNTGSWPAVNVPGRQTCGMYSDKNEVWFVSNFQ
jgi:hypothetical protein